MSLANSLMAKVAVAVATTAVLGVGTATGGQRHDDGAGGRASVTAGDPAVLPAGSAGSGAGEVVIDPGTGALSLLNDEGARAGVGAGARTRGSGPGRQGPVGARPPSLSTGGVATAGPSGPAAETAITSGSGTTGGPGGTGGGNAGGSTPRRFGAASARRPPGPPGPEAEWPTSPRPAGERWCRRSPPSRPAAWSRRRCHRRSHPGRPSCRCPM